MVNKDYVCGQCQHFIGLGDWNLCCEEQHDGYELGFLCYKDTAVCDKFEFSDAYLASIYTPEAASDAINEVSKRLKEMEYNEKA